jgi:hypothetical protein
MILDGLLQFDPAFNGALAAGTYNSTNVIDLGVTSGIPSSANGGGARDLGIGDDPALKIFSCVTTAFLGGTSIGEILQGAPDNGAGAPGTWTTFWTGPVILTANLIQGCELANIDMPKAPQGVGPPRFLRMQYVILGTMTAGIIQSEIVLDRFDQIKGTTGLLSGYRAGITVAN